MKKQRIAFSVFGRLAVLAAAIFLGSAQANSAERIPGEYLVKYKGHSFVSMTSISAHANVRIADHNPYGSLVKVLVNRVNEPTTLAKLMKDPNVEYVVPNIKLKAFEAPATTQGLQPQWAIEKVGAAKAWARAGNKGSRNVIVAVIDTGADYNHEALKPNMVPGYDFKENKGDPYDKTGPKNPGHGTHCSGIIGASGLIDGGIVGISPEVSMMPLRFLGEDGSGDLNAGIKAVDHAIQKGAHVISASWGAKVGRQQAMPLVEAVKRASDAGVIFVAAAANAGTSNDTTEYYPTNANFDNTISVAASGSQDEKPSWSNYGKRTVHIAAPGLTIMSTLPQNKYGNLSGTSMATPLISGMVALLKAQKPNLTGAQARALMQQTAAKVQIETACNCRLDAASAMETLLSEKMFITPAAGTVEIGSTMKFEGTQGKAPFTFESSNSAAGTIAADGTFTAVAAGDTMVTVKDSAGQVATSLPISVVAKSSGSNPGNPGSCPLGDDQLCQILCQIQPDLPFCKQR